MRSLNDLFATDTMHEKLAGGMQKRIETVSHRQLQCNTGRELSQGEQMSKSTFAAMTIIQGCSVRIVYGRRRLCQRDSRRKTGDNALTDMI